MWRSCGSWVWIARNWGRSEVGDWQTSKLVRVDDEALVVGDFVIQGPSCLVGNLGLPVNAAASGGARRLVHSKNELTSDTKTPPILHGEEVLHVTDIAEARRTAMKKVVRKSDDATTVLGHECVNRF